MFVALHVSQLLSKLASAPVVTPVTRWPVESQQQARRNAMIASTALARRRAELDEVEEFLASLGGNPAQEVAAHG